ncbi:hypothetical protein AB0M95_29200 [Sphaerisporangium sp. NPDC051017]|uniref:DUF7662 domain-containing protein n=1 Tax=Sphaerisporangium sp. NPDC051017 TaxID=3154636 RepID=UPI003447D844
MVTRAQYERLARHLERAGDDRIGMTFAEVAVIIGNDLPPSAFTRRAWRSSDPGHTQAVWLDAGYAARPDFGERRVTFIRTRT